MKVGVDRIDEGIAVLIVQDETGRQVRLPASLLPAGCREGDLLELDLNPDPTGTKAARRQVSALLGNLKKKG